MKAESYLTLIEGDLRKKLDRLPAEPSSLYDPVRYFMSLGGKRIRPVLVLSASALYNPDPTLAVGVASAMELFHNFSLVHDDIMDNAPLRRGKSTIHVKWDLPTGILSGDAMLVLVYQWLTESGLSREGLSLFNEGALKVCEGQQLDMVFQNQEKVSLEEYMDMTAMKTGWLLGTCLAIGALSAGGKFQSALRLREYGILQGQCFQLMDDLLDVYGQENFGKKTGGDIIERKKTWLLLKAMESGKEEIEACYREGNPEDIVRSVKSVYDKFSVRQKAEKEIESLNNRAHNILRAVEGPEEAKNNLEELFNVLSSRLV